MSWASLVKWLGPTAKFSVGRLWAVFALAGAKIRLTITGFLILLLVLQAQTTTDYDSRAMAYREVLAKSLIEQEQNLEDFSVRHLEAGSVVPGLEDNDTKFTRLLKAAKYLYPALSSIWFIYMFYYIMYKILAPLNTSEVYKHYLWAILVVLTFQSLMGLWIFLDSQAVIEGASTLDRMRFLGENINPIRGIKLFGEMVWKSILPQVL